MILLVRFDEHVNRNSKHHRFVQGALYDTVWRGLRRDTEGPGPGPGHRTSPIWALAQYAQAKFGPGANV